LQEYKKQIEERK